MKTKLFYPDYNCSILSIPNTIMQHYGIKNNIPALPKLEKALNHNYKNVVLIILDGMGIDMMQHNLPLFSFLRRNIKDKITSVFPPTTVAATTTYYSGLSPIEHGWLGWAPYFKQLNHVVEIYTNKDYYTGEKVAENVAQKMPYANIFEKIQLANSNIQTTEIFPAEIKPGGAKDFDDFCSRIQKQSNQDGNQFILGYWPEPDATSHQFGPYSKNVRKVLKNYNLKIKKLCHNLHDTLVIISADHGHIEIKKEILLNDYPDLMDCLSAPLALDSRAHTVYLEPNKEETFVSLFNQYLSKDFILIKSDDSIAAHLFGYGKEHPFAKDLLGDYLIISKTENSLVQRFTNDVHNSFLGNHSGLTNKELIVPLIFIERIK